jgi:spore coat polysaccharide biosynthesis predicted glycosyltransferase SpsG
LKKILLAFDDPGGGLVVSSLLNELKKIDSSELTVYSGKLSEKFLKDFPFKKLSSDLTESESEQIIDEIKPDMIITATGGGRAEQELRNIAFRENIKSIVVLDFWKDYKRRWKYASYKLNEMKDIVCVMDELTKEEMVSDSFPEDKLFVTGHAYLDKLFNSKDSVETEKQGNGILKENKVDILFLSQPLSIIGVVDYKIHPLETCIQAVSELKEFDGKKLSLKIKPHPIESELDEISILLKKLSSKKIEISITEVDEDLNKLIGEADIVIGYNTIAMFEARAMNKRTISLNVVPVRNSLSKAMYSAGIEITDCSIEEIKNCLKLKKEIKSDSKLFAGGIENCIKLVKSELNLN